MTEPAIFSPLEGTVAIVGVGMIGGSLAATLKRRNIAKSVVGVGRDKVRIEAARTIGLLDEAVTDISAVLSRVDLIVFCTPVEYLAADVRSVFEALRAQAASKSLPLLTDVGSVKGPICRELSSISSFIGSHPIAGSHRQGFEASNSRLFEGRTCIITPLPESDRQLVERLERFWNAVGMTTIQMSPEAHDSALAMTSHLPHVVAAALAATLTDENRSLTGSGFRDTTRIAAGDPDLWTGILLNNSHQVLQGIAELQSQLEKFQEALVRQDTAKIRHLLELGQRSRMHLEGTGQTPG